MSKKLDPDIKVLRAVQRALVRSSSPRMLRANLRYFWGRYMADGDAGDNVAAAFAAPPSDREGGR